MSKAYPKYKPSGVEWLGDVPEHWEVKRVDFLATVKARLGWKGLTADEYVNDGYIFLSTPNIKGENDIDFQNVNYISKERYFESPEIILKEGDVILAKDGSTLGTVNRVKRLPSPATVNSSLAILRPQLALESEFLFRWISSPIIQSLIEKFKDGQGVPHLFQADIRKFLILLPPLPEQQAIAAFLDRETGRIDALIAKKERLLELLAEQRTALISRAVTKGLDTSVKLKPSGVEWLGDVPEHWVLKAIKWTTPVFRGASPRPIDDPVYFDDEGEYAWVRIADVTASKVYLEETTQRLSDIGSSLSVKMQPGALFVSIAGTVGVPCITKIKCCIHDGFIYFPRLKTDTKFMYYIFACGEPYKGLGKMGTQLNLNTDTVGSIVMGYPPLTEQQAIAAYLDRETAKIDALSGKVTTVIERLKEYRTALISSAVTGKIDVREAV